MERVAGVLVDGVESAPFSREKVEAGAASFLKRKLIVN
jgi:hypothetical protein